MKQLTFLLFIFSCSVTFGQKNINDLQNKGGTWFAKGSEIPYTGTFVEYFGNGSLQGTGAFKKGLPDGLRVQYYENKKSETTYSSGVKDGPSTDYHENGKISQEGIYKAGKTEGSWKIYYPGGQLKAVLTFVKGVEKGDYFEYSEAGKLTAQYYIVN